VKLWRGLAVLLCAAALVGCLPAARYHASPLDALTEAPGRLVGLNAAEMATVQVRAEITAAGGELLLYNWRPPALANDEELALTLVAPVDDGGWRAQASAATELGAARDFVAAWATLGDAADAGAVVACYGWSDDPDAAAVEATWSDGARGRGEVSDRVYLLARSAAEGLEPTAMTLLAADGRVLAAWPQGD
jgi:hypothetical protein